MRSPDRLTTPLVRRDGRLEPATWDEAMGLIVEPLEGRDRALRRRARIGFYNSGQLFLEEYYTLAVVAEAGHRHSPRRRQHPPVHRDGGATP